MSEKPGQEPVKPKWWPKNQMMKPGEILAWEKASDEIWRAIFKNIGDDYCMASAIMGWIDDALDGSEPSDFAMSFPLVRKAFETSEAACGVRK